MTSFRSMAAQRPLARVASLVITVACACRPTSHAAAPAGPPVLLPGSRALQPLTLRPGARGMRVFVQRAPDSAERVMSDIHRDEWPTAGDARHVAFTFRYDPPYDTRDTLVVRRDGLAPTDEVLRANGRTIRIHYEGRRVRGTVQAGDSVPQAFAVDAAEVPFAFNELEPLVRSLPLRRGVRFVVPLFSEIDRAVEHDTVAVVGDSLDAASGARTWLVRFADPAIVSVYAVDARTRLIVSQEIAPRRGGRVRFVPLATSP